MAEGAEASFSLRNHLSDHRPLRTRQPLFGRKEERVRGIVLFEQALLGLGDDGLIGRVDLVWTIGGNWELPETRWVGTAVCT